MYVNGIREIKFNDVPNDKYSDMINSVIGQLSDGIWENNSRLSGYYIFTNGTNDGMTIKLLEHNPTPQYYRKINKYYKNPYYSMSDTQVLRYFANKIKEIALIELKDMLVNNTDFFSLKNAIEEYINILEGEIKGKDESK